MLNGFYYSKRILAEEFSEKLPLLMNAMNFRLRKVLGTSLFSTFVENILVHLFIKNCVMYFALKQEINQELNLSADAEKRKNCYRIRRTLFVILHQMGLK